MTSNKTWLLSHPCQLDHGIQDHPEHASRLRSIIAAIQESPYQALLNLSNNRSATESELKLVHDPAYVSYILSLEGKSESLDYETILTPGSVKAALSAAGLGLELVEKVVKGEINNGFALVRPPGHHARGEQGMGFCLFNNIAIAAKKALSMGVKKILILDWDVHHGNGTQETFYDDDRVLMIDLHQENLFPANSGLIHETGRGQGLGYTVNIPLPPGCHDTDYRRILDTQVTPLALKYRPELILVSAGFDAHESDPLGDMRLSTAGYHSFTATVKSLADQLCHGRLVLFLEGGYDPYSLAKNVLACVQALTAEGTP